MIHAFTTLDCAFKVRVRYELPCALTLDVVQALQGEVTINHFSRHVVGAKDHFAVSLPQMYAGGVMGDCWVVATFGKLDGEAPTEAIDTFEQQLVALCCAQIHRVTPEPAAV